MNDCQNATCGILSTTYADLFMSMILEMFLKCFGNVVILQYRCCGRNSETSQFQRQTKSPQNADDQTTADYAGHMLVTLVTC